MLLRPGRNMPRDTHHVARVALSVAAAWVGYVSRLLAKCLILIGLSTNSAISPAMTLHVIATVNPAPQPCDFAMPAAMGTSSAPAPLAVYNMPAFEAANLAPNVSPCVAGNRLKI